jgi:hypothetical protein
MIFEHDARVVMGVPVSEGKGVRLDHVVHAPEPADRVLVDTPPARG